MAKTIKISDELFDMLKFHSHLTKRSVPKQLEYWSEIGKIAEENPDNYSVCWEYITINIASGYIYTKGF